MNEENEKQAKTSFGRMLGDFVNLNLEKNNMGAHKNL